MGCIKKAPCHQEIDNVNNHGFEVWIIYILADELYREKKHNLLIISSLYEWGKKKYFYFH